MLLLTTQYSLLSPRTFGPNIMSKDSKSVIETMLGAVLDDASKEHSRVKSIFKKVVSHPIKMLAAFFSAPFLIIRLAIVVQNPWRRGIAVVGLFLAVLLAYLSGTFLGTFVGAMLVMSGVGFLVGVGFLFGSLLSVFLSLTFSVLVLNSVSFIFLKLSTQEVVDYLHSVSSDTDNSDQLK